MELRWISQVDAPTSWLKPLKWSNEIFEFLFNEIQEFLDILTKLMNPFARWGISKSNHQFIKIWPTQYQRVYSIILIDSKSSLIEKLGNQMMEILINENSNVDFNWCWWYLDGGTGFWRLDGHYCHQHLSLIANSFRLVNSFRLQHPSPTSMGSDWIEFSSF